MKHEKPFTEYHEKQTQSGKKIWPVYVILQEKNVHQKFLQKM